MLSDFNHIFWPIIIASITILGIIGCYILLKITGKRELNVDSNTTSGHIWDEDIEEKNNPLPLWWVQLFIITMVFGLIYLYMYPGIILTDGYLGWSQVKQYEEEVDAANKKYADMYGYYGQMNTDEFMGDHKAIKIGKKIFLNNCAQCHGSDANGMTSFPNLTDRDWLYGGEIDNIKKSITQGRNGTMPAMINIIGTKKDIQNVAHYVQSLSGAKHRPQLAIKGKEKFGVCAACHGTNGKGNQYIGAPNLTDDIWLHGKGIDEVIHRVTNGISNTMPSWHDKLTPEQIHIVSLYVWSLSSEYD
jgi:cytochrome c oxidase cbb3-type subunit 3